MLTEFHKAFWDLAAFDQCRPPGETPTVPLSDWAGRDFPYSHGEDAQWSNFFGPAERF